MADNSEGAKLRAEARLKSCSGPRRKMRLSGRSMKPRVSPFAGKHNVSEGTAARQGSAGGRDCRCRGSREGRYQEKAQALRQGCRPLLPRLRRSGRFGRRICGSRVWLVSGTPHAPRSLTRLVGICWPQPSKPGVTASVWPSRCLLLRGNGYASRNRLYVACHSRRWCFGHPTLRPPRHGP